MKLSVSAIISGSIMSAVAGEGDTVSSIIEMRNDVHNDCYPWFNLTNACSYNIPHYLLQPTALITPFPTMDSVPVPAPTSTCMGSTPDWVDVDGDGCGWYEASDLPGCPYWGDWAGIDDNTGEFIVGGSVANDNCCYCFGTAVSVCVCVCVCVCVQQHKNF